MPKRYWGIIITYVIAQLSGFIVIFYSEFQQLSERMVRDLLIYWQVGSFILALIISLLLLMKEKDLPKHPHRTDVPLTIIWSIAGVFLAFIGQMVANLIQVNLFNIDQQSQNTVDIMAIAFNYPIFIIVVSVIGPILEELIFRKIIFGEIYKRSNYWIAAIISGLAFALIHFDFTHLLVYFIMGLVFSFIYVQTKRIIVPIIAHVAMNSIVVAAQFYMQTPEMQELIDQMQQVQMIFIGG